MDLRRVALALACALLAAPATALAQDQPPLDITKLPYQPIGYFKPGDAIPADYGKACDAIKPQLQGRIFNPSGVWNSFDTTIYENFCLPFRNQDDTSANDPDGNGGEPKYGYCANPDPTDPLAQLGPAGAGTCPNHQLEYIGYYRTTMLEVLKDFSPTFHEYDFEHPEGIGRNPAIVVAGRDHPDEHIVIGSHYDQTTTGPASIWDSQEGHAEMIRVAKLMADYWKATGTGPSATVKFMPTDGEEDGSLGSAAYVSDFVVPGEEAKVRSYWNADPCAGGYPARRYGNPADVIPINIQIGISNEERVQKFNEGVPKVLEETLDALDDTIEVYPDQPETFISTAENPVTTDVGKHVFVSTDHPFLFSSDWTNFIAAGIPFFNPSPKVTGPSSPNGAQPSPFTPQNPYPDALIGFHSPVDNLQTMSRFTGQDPAGNQYPEPYMKGMEFCSHLLAWGMLQPNAGGAQTANATTPVAYYEAQPNEAATNALVDFDASGSFQYTDVASRTFIDSEERLQFKWDFGDGSKPAYGKHVRHAYRQKGKYASRLTVTNRRTAKSATMGIPVTVEDRGTLVEIDPPGQDVDPFPAPGSIVACRYSSGFATVKVSPAGRGLRFDLARKGANNNRIKVDVLRASTTRRAIAPRKVASFQVGGSFTWKGKPKRGRLGAGTYFVRVSVIGPNGQADKRAFAFTRTGTRFKVRKPFERTPSCGLISTFRLGAPAFGGKRSLQIGFAATRAGTARLAVSRGKKVMKRITRKADANRFQIVKVAARKLRRRGEYRAVLKFAAGGRSQRAALYARRY